jgi:hypothetical protein
MNLASRLLLCLSLIACSIGFSQKDSTKYPIVRYYEGDTVLIFNLEQARQITIHNEKHKECQTLNELSEKQIEKQDTIIKMLESEISNFDMVVADYEIIIANKDGLIDICEKEKQIANDEIRRQKIGKYIAIGSAVAIGIIGIIF